MKFYIFFALLIIFVIASGYTLYEKQLNAIDGYPIPKEYREKTNFELGHYFFNHDDDPSGPYDLNAARHFYQKSIEEDAPTHQLAWYQLSRIDFIEGEFDASLEKLQRQQELFGEQIPNIYYMRGLVYGYKAKETNDPNDWHEGEIAFERFIELTPLAPWPRVDLAWLYFLQGKYEQMKPVLEEGLTFRPTNPWLLNMYGLALLNTQDKEGAYVQFLKAWNEAEKLTEEDWGKAYPGNNPEAWGQGLADFRLVISKNIELAQQ